MDLIDVACLRNWLMRWAARWRICRSAVIFFTARTALWVALALAGAGGLLAGYLLGRKRYRS